uniref:Nucleotide binding oligomerization domain containing 1 n=1 Tax=Ailuropoda melanoleuca TaxID=9646 RepID=A0A7N5K947_AILME
MEKQGHREMGMIPSEPHSHVKLLKINRELLVTHIRNTQCLVDNLLRNDYFTSEDAEIVCACPTQPDKVRKILDLVQSKGEEVSEFLLYVLQQLADAYVDLRPWLSETGFSPSELIQSRVVVNTDPAQVCRAPGPCCMLPCLVPGGQVLSQWRPGLGGGPGAAVRCIVEQVSRYTEKLRQQLGRDSKFVLCYAQKEELLLEEMYTDTIAELVGFQNESLGPLGSLASLLDHSTGVLSEQGETVFICGDAGVGKSVLLQRLQSQWAAGRLEAEFKFFFCFRCRVFSCFKEGDTLRLQDLLFKHYCYPEQDPDEVFAFLLRFPQTALFTFDGLDELHSDFDLSGAPDTCSPWEPAHPLVLLANLLSGKLLKGAGKLLTARTGVEIPRQFLRKKVLLRGFSPSHLRTYTRRMFPDRAVQERLLAQLEASPSLCSLCAVPLFCWIIFRCFQHFHSVWDGSAQLPDCTVTLTDVFLLVTEVHLNRTQPTSLVQRNTRSRTETFRAGRGTLRSLGQVAHWGMEKNLFVFGPAEVQAAEVQEGELQLGFLRAVPEQSLGGEQQSYEFFHLTLQAFFTAFFLVVDDKCLKGSGLAGEDPFKNKDHFQFTNLFLCGLLSKAKQKLLRHLVPAAALRRKRKALWAHLFASLRAHLKNLPRVQVEGFNQVQAMPTFVWMLRCIYETQSEKVARLAAKGICANYLKLTYCNACSADCSALSFVLHHFRKRLALDLDNNNLNDYGVRELQPCFSCLTVIRLSVNQITDSGVKVLYEELTKYKILTFLGLYNNQITDVGARYIARILDECKGLTHLKLGENKITSEGGKCLALAVKNSKSIFEIGLAFNGISTEGGKSLAQALQHNTTLRIFWLTKNELNDEVAESLAEMLKVNQTLKHLWLIQNQITAKGIAQLADALQSNTGIMEI